MRKVDNAELWIKHVDIALRRDYLRDIPAVPIELRSIYEDPSGAAAAVTNFVAPDFMQATYIALDPDMLTTNRFDFVRFLGADIEGYGIAASLAHELAHVAQDGFIRNSLWDGHDAPDFRSLIALMGLEGRACCTRPGPEFKAWIDRVVRPAYEQELSDGRSGDTAISDRRPKAGRPASLEVAAAGRDAA